MANEMALRFRVEASMAEAKAALDQGAAAFRKFGTDAKAAMSQAATGYQGLVNDFAGVKPAFASAADSANAFKEAMNLQDQMNNLRASLDPAYAATLQFSQAQDLAAQAVARGAVSQAQADATLTALAQKLGIAEGASQSFAAAQTQAMAGANRNAAVTSNVAAQFNDIGVMLAAGQNPFMLAIQQGTQLSQVLVQAGGGIKGATAALKAGFMAMLSPTTLLTIAIIAGGAALVQWAMNAGGAADAAKEAADATDAYGDALGTVQSQFSAATSLHAEYVQAVLSGNTQLIKAIELEAKARQAQFNLDRIGQQEALKEALKTQADQRAARDATYAKAQDVAKRIAALEAERAKYKGAPDGAVPADLEPKLEAEKVVQTEIAAVLRTQGAELAKTEATNAVIIAQAGVLDAKLAAVGDVVAIVKDGVDGTGDALDNAADKADKVYASAVKLLAGLQQEAVIRAAIAKYGADSVQVAQLRLDAEKKVFAASVAAMDVSISLKRELMAAWTAANGIADADMSGAIDRASSSAGELARKLGVSLDIAKAMMAGGFSQEPVVLDPRDPRYDAGRAAREANFGFQYDTTSPFDPSRQTDTPAENGGRSGATSANVMGLSSQAQAALTGLDLAIATINEKVRAGLMTTAEAGDALTDARTKAGNDIAGIIAQVDRLGPAGQAAATALRASLIDVTADLKGPIDDLAASLSDGLSGPLKDFMKNTKTAEQVFQAFGDSVIDKLLDIAIQQAQTNLFQPVISGALSGLGGVGTAIAGAFGFSTGAAPNVAPPPRPIAAFAKGGDHLGGLRIVGEEGPELEATGPSRIFNAKETARILSGRDVGNRGGDAGAMSAFAQLARVVQQPAPLRSVPKMNPMAGVNAAMSMAGAQFARPAREADAKPGANQPAALAPRVEIKIEGVPAGHTATVDQKTDGMDQMLTVVIERVESAIGSNIRSGRGSVGSAISDTYGLGRRPR